ncbi:hypothetical protein [Phenylobacterium sp. J367]|uniref:hypothetical protein n=1 Tax=Phenylobacterium sp. J367 TaxID=2898435 RepID=UPI002150D407|nr:hypothetical protein [Phenylobacterium sp. J367]MCR5878944.1 hypothetical protein [Phenylobacterium sp. J367]
MGEILLYGLDEADAIVLTERFGETDRSRLRAIARERLERCAAVEVWDGQICVMRLKRGEV